MPRYYQSSTPEDVDFLYQLPENAMLQAVQTGSEAIGRAEDKYDLLQMELAKIKNLSGDDEVVKQITDSYNQRISDLTFQLKDRPQDYRKQMPLLRDMSRELATDLTNGKLAKAQSNYQAYQEWEKSHKERLDKGEINSAWYNAARNQLNNFKGTFNEDGSTNTLNMPYVPKHIDIGARVDDWIKDAKANGIDITYDSVTGAWMQRTKEGLKQLTTDELAAIAYERLKSDDELVNNLMVGQQLGIYKDPMSVFKSAVKAAANKYAYSEQTKSNTIEGMNPWAAKRADQAFTASENEKRRIFDHNEAFLGRENTRFLNSRKRLDDFYGYAHDLQRQMAELEGSKIPADQAKYRTLKEQYRQVEQFLENAKSIYGQNDGFGDYGVTSGKTEVIGDVIKLKPSGNSYDADWTKLQGANIAIQQAEQQGDSTALNIAKATSHTLSSRISQARHLGYKAIEKFSQEDKNQFHKYLTDPEYRKKIDAVTTVVNPNSRAPIGRSTMVSETAKKMQYMMKQFNKGVSEYYDGKDGINSQGTPLKGLPLTGEFKPLVKLVTDYIKGSPEQLEVVDASNSQFDAEVTNAVKEAITTGKGNKASITHLVPHDGSSFVIDYNGKKYLGKFAGDTNFDDIVTKHVNKHTSPDARRFVDRMTDSYKKALIYDMQQMSKGETKIIPMETGDLSSDPLTTSKSSINVRIDALPNGQFQGAIFHPIRQEYIPVGHSGQMEDLAEFMTSYIKGVKPPDKK